MNDPRVYLVQILERLERIAQYTRGGREAFMADPLIQDAVIRNFEVIGEAAKRVPDDYRQTHPEIPWRSLAAFRDVLIHQYGGVDIGKVWGEAIRSMLPLWTSSSERSAAKLRKTHRIARNEGGADRPRGGEVR